jgi:hypothetical protein
MAAACGAGTSVVLVHGREWVMLDRHGEDKRTSVATHQLELLLFCEVAAGPPPTRCDLSVMAKQMTCRCCFAAPKLECSGSTGTYRIIPSVNENGNGSSFTAELAGVSSLVKEPEAGLDRFASQSENQVVQSGANNILNCWEDIIGIDDDSWVQRIHGHIYIYFVHFLHIRRTVLSPRGAFFA